MSKQSLLGKESLAEKMQKIKKEMDIKETPNISHDKKEFKPVQKSSKKAEGSSQTSKNKVNPKLFVSGRLDRKKYEYVAKSLILLTQLEDEIKIYCRGGDLAILNYLIKEGLEKVKASNTPINVDIEEIENDIT